MAIERASHSETSHETVRGKLTLTHRQVLHSGDLFSELRWCSDYLAAGLMAAGHPLRSTFFREEAEAASTAQARLGQGGGVGGEGGMEYEGRSGRKEAVEVTGGWDGARGPGRRRRGMERKARVMPLCVDVHVREARMIPADVLSCLHACIHTYMHAYVRTCMHVCMYTYMHTYVHTCMHACMRADYRNNAHVRSHPFHPQTTNTQVLPVYVLSLQRAGHPPLIDGNALVAASKDAVVVIQHGDQVSLPFFAGTEQLVMDAANPSAAILEGILTALGGVAHPARRFSAYQAKEMLHMLFVHGSSCFGPFGGSMVLSEIHVDHALRNAVLWRLHTAVSEGLAALYALDAFAGKYLVDANGERADQSRRPAAWFHALSLPSFADSAPHPVQPSLAHSAATQTLGALHAALLELEADLTSVSERLYSAHVSDAFHSAEVCLNKAMALRARTTREIGAAEDALACCVMTHSVVPRNDNVAYVRAALVGVIAVCLVIIVIAWHPQRRSPGRRVTAVSLSAAGAKGRLL